MFQQSNGSGLLRLAAAGAAVFLFAAAAGGSDLKATMTAVLQGMWSKPAAGWESRIAQDETQEVCSRFRNHPPEADTKAIMAREQASIVYPTQGNVQGDWKEGEKIAGSGRGGQFSDPPNTVNGGNCYACHQMAKKELSFGTLGPSLLNYGRDREFSPEAAMAAYAKIFNAQASVACSNMPRFGANKFLSEQQIKDVVAFLFDRDSPVNQ